MSCQRFFTTVLLGVLPLGCSIAPLDDAAAIEAPALMEEGIDQTIVSMNGLLPGVLVDPTLVSGMADLADAKITVPSALIESKDGRSLMGHIVHCALGKSTTIEVLDKDRTPHSFTGHLNLAPEWLDAALSTSAQRWVSACLLAHANAYGLELEIDIRGTHSAISGPGETGFTQQEASFYGNVFGTTQAFACLGAAPSAPEGMPRRVCGRTGACGFNIAGSCGTPAQDAVCAGGPDVFASCLTVEERPEALIEVVTVFTKPGMFGNPEDKCPHAPDKEGWPLAESCSQKVADVCAIDPYCCQIDWDSTCVDLADGPMPTIP